MEFRTIPQFRKAADKRDDRTELGIFCVHGNVDDGIDKTFNGALAQYEVDGRDRVRYLWNHGGGFWDRGMTPPIATIKHIKELDRDALPEEVLNWAPDATGGVEVEREYLPTPRGDEILIGVRAGAITEMSYAYDVLEYKYVKQASSDDDYVREIYKMSLYDISDVNWGMNPATLGSKSSLLAGLAFADHSTAVVTAVQEWIDRAEDIKRLREADGKNLSSNYYDRLKSLYASLGGAQERLAVIIESLQQEAKSPDLARETAKLRSESNTLHLRLMNLGVQP